MTSPTTLPAQELKSKVLCPVCRQPMDPTAMVCPACNQYSDWTAEMEKKALKRRRLRVIGPILSAIIPGLGQFVQRRIGAGILFITLFAATAGMSIFIWKGLIWGVWAVIAAAPVVWIVNIIEARLGYRTTRAPCQRLCPIQLDIPGYQAMIAEGRYREAYALIKQKLPLPGTCGRICVAFCQAKCNPWLREHMAIRDLKRFAADGERKAGPPPAANRSSRKRSDDRVAIIGGGPAGLTAAYFLAKDGVRATIFEAAESLGGMVRQAIPRYRLPLNILEEEVNSILSLGIDLQTGVRVGKTISLKEIMDDGYRAAFLSTGAPLGTPLRIPGEDKEGVMSGLDFLRAANAGRPPELGSTVVIVGGGNVAVDAARTAYRLGVEYVVIAYRRTSHEMPASPEEIAEVREEGIAIMFLVGPKSVFGGEKVEGIELTRMALGRPDASGRRRPIPIEASEFIFPCDQIIVAVGQRPDPSVCNGLDNINFRKNGTLVVTKKGRVKIKEWDLFAGGDLTRGPASFIEAVSDGRKAYFSIMRRLGKKPTLLGDWEIDQACSWKPDPGAPRAPMPSIPLRKRANGFKEVLVGYSWEEATREARRCLRCNKGY